MIHLTPAAIRRIRELIESKHAGKAALRLGVKGGGCSGMTYMLSLDDSPPKAHDQVLEQDGVRIYLDPKSQLYIDETTIDFKDDLMNGGFEFRNPQAKKSCGCGTSFSTE